VFILLSTFSEGLTRFAAWPSISLDMKKFFNLEDIYSVRILVLAVVFTSVATFFFAMLARGMGISPKLARLLSTTLIYYLSVQLMIALVTLLSVYALNLLAPSMDLLAILLAVSAALASLLLWVLGALMLFRASPLNKIRGWRRVISLSAVTSAVILIFIGTYMLLGLINIEGPIEKTVDIVDGECRIDNSGLQIEEFVHNSSTTMYKIKAISVSVAQSSGESAVYTIKYPLYLKADDTKAISVGVPKDEFLNSIISMGEPVECRYELLVQPPWGAFKLDLVKPATPHDR
jgi:hypothetical protein